MIVGELLSALGHEVEFAKDGSSAFEVYSEALRSDRPFDMVILDLTVRGGMGGEEAMRLLREIDPHVKAVVSSGYADNPVIADYRGYGFKAYLKKPYRVEQLKEVISEVLS